MDLRAWNMVTFCTFVLWGNVGSVCPLNERFGALSIETKILFTLSIVHPSLPIRSNQVLASLSIRVSDSSSTPFIYIFGAVKFDRRHIV